MSQEQAKKRDQLRITLDRSMIGRPQRQRRTLYALGLRKRGRTVTRPDGPVVRGMVAQVQHLVKVEHIPAT